MHSPGEIEHEIAAVVDAAGGQARGPEVDCGTGGWLRRVLRAAGGGGLRAAGGGGLALRGGPAVRAGDRGSAVRCHHEHQQEQVPTRPLAEAERQRHRRPPRAVARQDVGGVGQHQRHVGHLKGHHQRGKRGYLGSARRPPLACPPHPPEAQSHGAASEQERRQKDGADDERGQKVICSLYQGHIRVLHFAGSKVGWGRWGSLRSRRRSARPWARQSSLVAPVGGVQSPLELIVARGPAAHHFILQHHQCNLHGPTRGLEAKPASKQCQAAAVGSSGLTVDATANRLSRVAAHESSLTSAGVATSTRRRTTSPAPLPSLSSSQSNLRGGAGELLAVSGLPGVDLSTGCSPLGLLAAPTTRLATCRPK